METKFFKSDMYKVLPIISQEGSDSAMLDNALEFMVMSGMELPMAVMILIPAPWQHDRFMPQESQGLLPLLCNHDGAMGWPGLHCIQ